MSDETCPECGLAYAAFRTGLDFGDVRKMMWSADPDPSTWRYKRRHGVLGFWRSIKLRAFASHVAECSYYAEQERRENADSGTRSATVESAADRLHARGDSVRDGGVRLATG